MKLCFLGDSHAAQHLSRAAAEKGFELCDLADAELVFVSQDTPTDEAGRRDLGPIRALVERAMTGAAPVVLTSAVPPGFTRGLGMRSIWHQAETLRMIDAEERALRPEMLIVGSNTGVERIPDAYLVYLTAFGCPILRMTWEEAELAKVAINVFLAAQVDTTNALAHAAAKVGASWERIADVLRHDNRVGPHAYLEPGRWQDSRHLLRDMRTLTRELV